MPAAPLTQSVTLNNGTKMPAFGLGTWLSNPGEVGKAVEVALENGYRHIDGAGKLMNISVNVNLQFRDHHQWLTTFL